MEPPQAFWLVTPVLFKATQQMTRGTITLFAEPFCVPVYWSAPILIPSSPFSLINGCSCCMLSHVAAVLWLAAWTGGAASDR